jgi:beta-hydroxylase
MPEYYKIIFLLIIIIIFIILFLACRIIFFFKNKNKIFLTTKQYPQFKILEDNWKIIRKEIPLFNINKISIERSQDTWLGEKMDKFVEKFKNKVEWFKAWADNDSWYNFPIIYNNKFVANVEEICPKTCNLLKIFKNIRIAGFSLLVPNGDIQIHNDTTGPNYNSMAFNMLLTGKNSSLYVKPENSKKFYKYNHKNGRAVIFNAEQYHFADNKYNSNRIILYIDFFTN